MFLANRSGEEVRNKILKYIVFYIQEHGYSPSVREIREGTELNSTSTVQYHLNRLFELGELETDARKGTARAIRVPGYKFIRE